LFFRKQKDGKNKWEKGGGRERERGDEEGGEEILFYTRKSTLTRS